MQNKNSIIVALLVIVLIAGGFWFFKHNSSPSDSNTSADIIAGNEAEAVKAQVENFGKELQKISLLAPADTVKADMALHYAPYLTPELLAAWQNDPNLALGRTVSSPWPNEIQVFSATKISDDQFQVNANVLEITSSDPNPANVYPITLSVVRSSDKWLISSVSKSAPAANTSSNPSTSSSGMINVQGIWECLPHRDTTGPETMECAFGLKTDAGKHYALNLQSLASQAADFPTNTRLKIEGTLIPRDSSNQNTFDKYMIEGIIRVSVAEKI